MTFPMKVLLMKMAESTNADAISLSDVGTMKKHKPVYRLPATSITCLDALPK